MAANGSLTDRFPLDSEVDRQNWRLLLTVVGIILVGIAAMTLAVKIFP
jgi:hypothetical protein